MSCLIILSILLAISSAQQPSIPRACSTPETNGYPFCNASLPLPVRINDLISRILDVEKPPLLTARESPGGGIPRIGLPEYDWGANCIHGVQSRCGTRCPTSFSNPNGLGATFNMTNVYQMGAIIGLELRSLWLQGVGENSANDLPHLGLDCWSPNINIARDPRWGRNQEVPGEDPYLSGQFGVAYTVGLQNGKLDDRYLQAVVTLKHWDAYSLENSDGWTRYNFNAVVSNYDFANTYFPAFKAAVVDGKAKGVMCAYNAVNGIPACASNFLNDTLRGAWGFDGYITSDSDAVATIWADHHYVNNSEAASALAMRAGTDIDSGSTYLNSLNQTVTSGLLTEADVDLALYHSLKMRFELGLFDPIEDQPYWQVPPEVVNTPETQAFNLFATQQTIVLLKNDANTLPFPKGKNIAVIGPHGNASDAMVGNYLGQICPGGRSDFSCITTPFLAIQALNVGGQTTYEIGCQISGNDTSGFEAAITAAKNADLIVLAVGIDGAIEGEMRDRINITLPDIQNQFAEEIFALGKPVAVVLLNGGCLAIEYIASTAPAIVEAFYPGFQGGNAIASVLFGDYNPGGKMPYTTYHANYTSSIMMDNMNMSTAPGRTYKYFSGPVLWPFGWGLSYTNFSLVWASSVSEPKFLDNTVEGAFVQYSVNVSNTGNIAGDEVVQAYFTPSNDSLIIKQLFGFQRVHLIPGAHIILSFQVSVKDLLSGDLDGNMVSTIGSHNLMFTNGVDLSLNTVLEVKGRTQIVVPWPGNSQQKN